MNTEGAVSLYKQAVVPIIEYCDFLIESGKPTLVRKLQTHQNNGLRICTRKKIGDISTNQLHKTCKVERLEPRRKRHLLCLIYRHAQDNDNCVTRLNRTRSDSKKKLRVERPKREKYRKGPLYRGMQSWDDLDTTVQNIEDVFIFKKKLRTVIK